jgi:hypothetical protein
MKVHCPSCSALVLAANLNLDTGWGKCDACQELFALAEVVPGFTTPGTEPIPQRPASARAVTERSADELLVYIPPKGWRGGACGGFGFTIFWLGFVGFWTAGAAGLFGGQGPGGQGPGPANIGFAAFSIPFWLVGFGMLFAIIWQIWGTKSVRIDREGMRTYQRCLTWSRTKWVELAKVQNARPYLSRVQNNTGRIPRWVEIVYQAGSFTLPVDSEEEEKWLVAEINDFLKSLAA